MAQLTNFWRNLLRGDRVERDLNDELRATLDLLVEEKVRAGMPPDQARRAARVELGAVEAIKDNVRDVRAGAVFGHLIRDLRYAARTLIKSRGFALIIVTTFALGSAGVTTMFALVNAILIQPLPYPGSDRLVAIKHAAPGLGLAEAGLSSGTYFHYRAHARSVETLAVYDETVLNLSTPGMGTERVEVTYAGPEFFDVLGVRPVLGRLLTTEDGRPGFMNMTWPIPVLLSHELWMRRYGGDSAIVGGTITLDRRARHVVGVLPPDFDFPRRETQIWMLFMPPERTASFARDFEYQAVARLRPGVSAAAAATELKRILPTIEGVYRDATAQRVAEVQLTPIVVPLKEEVVGDVASFLWLLFGGMTFLILMACANVATLSLLRAEHRDREVAVRTALGARRIDLLRLFVSEAGLLVTAGAALGLLLAHLALRAIVVFTPVRLPRLAEVVLDVWVFAFACGVAALAALLVGGLAFLRQTVPASTAATLNVSGRVTANPGSRRTRNALVIVQVALALTLLVGSALMAQSFWRLLRVDPGFDPADVLTIEIGLPGSMASRHQRIYEGVLEEVRALPGVRSAAAVSSLALDGTPDAYPMRLGARSRPTEAPIAMKFVTPGYFQTMRTPVVEGAVFALNENIEANAVVVSAALARRFFPGETAIGKQVSRLESDGQPVEMSDGPVPSWTIVGVVADVREESLRVAPAEIVYVPVRDPAVERSIVPTSMTLVIRAGVRSEALIRGVRNTIRAIEPAVSVARIRTMEEIVTKSIASERFLAALLLGAAAVSLFLAAIGVYGVAAHGVRRREREIGIRVSLGATPRQLVGMVLVQSAVLVVIGSTAGLALAFIATRALRSFLFDVSATDPATVGVATVLLVLTVLAAHVLPARRAVMLDPVAALRSE